MLTKCQAISPTLRTYNLEGNTITHYKAVWTLIEEIKGYYGVNIYIMQPKMGRVGEWGGGWGVVGQG